MRAAEVGMDVLLRGEGIRVNLCCLARVRWRRVLLQWERRLLCRQSGQFYVR